MFKHPTRILLLVLALGAAPLFMALARRSPSEVTTDEPRVRLAVLIVFDQMRGDYLGRWEKLFGDGGFRRMMKDGAWFQNCHYPYAATLTAPGHASIATGTSPSRHGIIANEWYDRKEGALVESIHCQRHRPVPSPANPDRIAFGVSPLRRRQPTIGDALLEATKGKARVVSLSLKDRSAILLAALRAICCWFSASVGGFVTSTCYADTLPPWVTDFNRARRADSFFDRDWTRLVPDMDYAAQSGPDDVAFEGIGYDQGRAFPHSLKAGLAKPGPAYYAAMLNSPYGNELLLELALRAIDAERLGQDETTDLLCLSFSSNDLIGHCWGPDSQEVLDVTLHSDRLMKRLLNHLDARVGRGRYVVVISSDHGICPIPEIAQSQGKKAGRVSPEILTTHAAAFLDQRFAAKEKSLPWIEATASGNIYLNQGLLDEQGLKSADVENALVGWLRGQSGILDAFSRSQLLNESDQDDLARKVRLSFDPERSGDVVVVLQPYHLLSPPISPRMAAYRTTHGSPHPYDTHVPLLVFGSGIQPGVHSQPVSPQAVAPILARALGIPSPTGCDTPLPNGIFQDGRRRAEGR